MGYNFATFGQKLDSNTMPIIRFSIIFTLLLVLFGCSIFPEEKDKTLNWSANKFYNEATLAMSDGDYELAIEYYEKLESRFPFGRYAMQAQLDIAYAYYKSGEPDLAIASANRFIKLHPQNPYVDYAYYLKGIANFNRSLGFIERFIPADTSQRDPGAALDSFNDFADLVRKFPNSEYALDAKKRLIYLRNNLAENELHVARYYMKRGAYLAAANRCVYVVEKYQRAPAMQNALEIMIEAYAKLDMQKLKDDAQRVLTQNINAGTFNIPKPTSDDFNDESVIIKAWEYLELDKN